MDYLIQIISIVVPAGLVFLASFLVLKKFIYGQENQKKMDLLLANGKVITPIKLQAYERIILFLERISPDSIIMRLNANVKTAQEMQSEILNAIRAEYEHNLSQQIYISSEAWEMVKNAKGNLIKLVNSVADGIDPKAPALKLSQAILEKVIEMRKSPVYEAVEFVKKEVQVYMK